MTYPHPFNHTNTSWQSLEKHQFHIPYLSISLLTLCAQTVSVSAHVSACTNVLAHVFKFYFPKSQRKNLLQKSVMFHNIDLLSWMDVCPSKKRHLITSGKNILQNFSWFASLSVCILKCSGIILSRGTGFGRLNSVRTLYQSSNWYNLLPANLQLNVMSSSHNLVFLFAFPKLYLCQTFGMFLSFL